MLAESPRFTQKHEKTEKSPSLIDKLRFNFSSGKYVLEEGLKMNIEGILKSPDFEKRFRSMITADLHVHPLKIIKKDNLIIIEIIDDETKLFDDEGKPGKLNVFRTVLNVDNLRWSNSIDGDFTFLLHTILKENELFKQFGPEYGSYTTVGIPKPQLI